MPIVAPQSSITVMSTEPGTYRFLRSGIAAEPLCHGKPALRFVFDLPKGVRPPTAWLVTSQERKYFYIDTQEDAGQGTFSVWVPLAYPQGMRTLNFRLVDEKNHGTNWFVSGLPDQSAPSELKESVTVGGVRISGSASLEQGSGLLTAKLNAPSLVDDGHWYWDAELVHPFEQPDVDTYAAEGSEWLYGPNPSGPFYNYLPFTGFWDRVQVEGALVHYTSAEEFVTCQLKAAPVSSTDERDEGRWRLSEDVVVTTPSGLKLLVTNPSELVGPVKGTWLPIEVRFDSKTLGSGLDKKPERIDVEFSDPVLAGQALTCTPGVSIQALEKGSQNLTITVDRWPIKSTMTLALRITRRTADMKRPFSLVFPVKHDPSQPVGVSPGTNP